VLNDEQRKLTVSWLNILAAGIVSTGVVTQILAVASTARLATSASHGLVTALVCLLLGITLHGVALTLVRSGRGERRGRETSGRQ
jgi:hypothetical protein